MLSVDCYRVKAVEFDHLATAARENSLKRRFTLLAEQHRLLAVVRQRIEETDDNEQPR